MNLFCLQSKVGLKVDGMEYSREQKRTKEKFGKSCFV